jgi:MFS transporter, PPP family, 3-phenylpropionic acid transporter
MSIAIRNLGARLSGLHATTFLGMGVSLPFLPVWLQSKALSATMIGVVIALPVVIRIAATAPLMTLVDRGVGPRRLLMASHLAQVIGYLLLMQLESGLAIAALIALVSVAHAAVVPTNDLVIMTAARRHPSLNYGLLRSSGSIAFLAASIGAGYLIDLFGADVVPWSLALLPVLALLAVRIALPSDDLEPAPAPEPKADRATPFPAVLWLVMAAFACSQASHAAVYTFGSIHWRAVGFSDTVIGALWAIGVVVEIGIFIALGPAVGRGKGAFALLLAGSAAVVVRFSVLALDPGLAVTFLMQALHGVTFAASHLGAMVALATLAPASSRGRAQGLLGSLSALALAVATVASGPIYRAAGPAVFAAMVPLGLAGIVFTLVAFRATRAAPRRPSAGG